MQDKVKEITFGEGRNPVDLREGVEIMQKGVGITYGPGGRNVLLKKRYVHPVLTRDGVTVARDIAGHGNKLKNPQAAEAAKLVYQASEKTNKTAGDGTTATVVLLAELYKAGYQRIVSGADAMVVKRQLDKDRDAIVKFVESKSVECDKKKLDQVATISSGDPELGRMISDLVFDVGSDGAITLDYQNAPSVEVEKVTGYLFGNGFKNLATEVEFEAPVVFVTQKRMAAKGDIIPVLEIANQLQKQFVIVGDVAGAAYETLVWAIQNQKADGLCIPPPAYGNDGHDYFEDIATYTGARLFLESDNFKDLTADDFGTIARSRISRDKAILFGDDMRVVNTQAIDESEQVLRDAKDKLEKITLAIEAPQPQPTTDEERDTERQVRANLKQMLDEAKKEVGQAEKSIVEPITIGKTVKDRINTIKKQMTSEISPSQKEVLDQRLAKLAGKVSIIKVGAATEVEREELFFRVEDAVEACKSALSSGIVAGGATTLLFAANELELEPFVKEALQQPFKLLMSNAAEDGGFRMHQVVKAGYGKGFNLREMTEEPIDLVKSGVVDATKVVLQTVKNAFSVAGSLLTTGALVTEEETDEKV